MKKLTLMFAILFCLNITKTYAVDMDITINYPPKSCEPQRIVVSSNLSPMINLDFSVVPINSNPHQAVIYIYNNNTQLFDIKSYPVNGYTHINDNIHLAPQNQPGLSAICLNNVTKLVIRVTDLGNYDYDEEDTYFIPYFATQSGNPIWCDNSIQAAMNGTVSLPLNIARFEVNHSGYGCGPIAAQVLFNIPRTKISWEIQHNSNQQVQLINENCNGWSASNPNNQSPKAVKEEGNTSTIISTFVYNVSGTYYPCPPNQAVVTYKLINRPANNPPIISSITQSRVLTYNTSAIFTANLAPESGPVSSYSWQMINNSGYNITSTTSSSNQFTITWNPNDISVLSRGPDKNITINCTAINPYGSYTKSTLALFTTNNGCPWLVVTDQDEGYTFDNNLLNKSLLPGNQGSFITDKYILKTKPGIFDSKIKLTIAETSIDSTLINTIKLYAVEHPLGTKLGITANNEIVYYDSASVIQTDNASMFDQYNNYMDITEDIQFHNPFKGINTHGDSLYHIYAEFKNSSISNPGIINFMERGIGYPTPTIKNDNSGNLFVNTPSGTTQYPFMRRENPDDVILPLTERNMVGSVDSIHIAWDKSFKIKYAAVASLNYSGFSITEWPLITAFHTSDGDVLQNLLYVDSGYTYVSPNAYLNLEFSNSPSMVPQVKTDYVLEINGQVIYLGNNRTVLTKVTNPNQNTIPDKYSLSQNYPNPFNPVTKINYSIPKQGLVTLKVYDMLGREIRSLVNEIKQPGNYTVDFNGSNLASGVYFYRLESNSFTSIKRMVLIK